jgi:lipopolysaccharide export LptBFGC system permease protein LptF
MGEMRAARLAPFLIPAAILLGESLVLGQPDTNLGLGIALLVVLALAFWVTTSVLQRD